MNSSSSAGARPDSSSPTPPPAAFDRPRISTDNVWQARILGVSRNAILRVECVWGATGTVTNCGRICFKNRKVNLSQAFAGQQVGVRQVDEHIWLVTFMHYDLGYFDDETCRLEPIENPFGPTVLPMSPE